MKYDLSLLPYATPRQAELLQAVVEEEGIRPAAKKLKLHHSSVGNAMKRLAASAARADPDLHVKEAPPGYVLRGASTLVNSKGEMVQQWIKTKQDKENGLELLRDAMEDITETHKGRLAALRPPKQTDRDLLAVYPLADAHVGLLSWAEETGADFDLKIAECVFETTVDRLVQSAPSAEKALFINLGDFFHADNASGRTTQGTYLDTDSRYAKIARAGLKIKRRIIDRLLQRHKSLEVWTLAGNHDENTAVMLAVALEAVYEREPRIRVSVDPARFQVRHFGNSLIGAAHGHTAKLDRLPSFMAATWPEEWGNSEHRIWYTGHVHHDSVNEHPGCTVETLRSVARRDAWHVGKAYHSGRDLKCDIWHKKNGRIARMIQCALGG